MKICPCCGKVYKDEFSSCEQCCKELSDSKNYISTTEASKRWGISPTLVRELCQRNRIPGAIQYSKGSPWCIPCNIRYPKDIKNAGGTKDSFDFKEHAGKVVIAFIAVIIISLIVMSQGVGLNLTIFLAVCCGVSFLGIIISFIVANTPTAEEVVYIKNQKSNELAQLAKKYGVNISEFHFDIGQLSDPIWIDTAHSLFAGECVIDTIKRTVVFPVSHILNCSLEEETETVSNAKSRAIVGGMLAGSVGAIAGASSATNSQHIIGYLLIINTDLPNIGTVVFRVNHRLGVEAIQYLKG